MKKFISIVLVVVMVLGVTACGNKSNTSKSDAKEIGIWSVSDIGIDIDAMKQSYESEGMEWNLSEDEIQDYKDFYKMFMGSLYLEFNEDGTGLLDFYIPEDEKYEGYQEGESASKFKWENGKIIYTDDGMEEIEGLEYVLEDDTLTISEEGMVIVFSKIDSLNEIENTEFWKSMEELKTQMNQMYDSFDEDSDIVLEEDVVEEVMEEAVEDDKND